MKPRSVVVVISFLALSLLALKPQSLMRLPEGWPSPHYDLRHNPLQADKVELGRALFYDPILSLNHTVSCASCHLQATAFAHVDHALSHGIDNHIGTRNAPALMNLAWQPYFMWDGAINHLDMQSLFPITHPDEMGEEVPHVVSKLQQSAIYPKLFLKAWGDSIVTGEHLLKSLAQFMLTLVSADSRYDSMKRGDVQFTGQEENGYRLFRAHCNSCHTEPLFTTFHFENNGLEPDTSLHDAGRMKITLSPLDSMKFKVPTLRNIEFSFPYMHDGRFKRLRDVLNHYTHPMYPSSTLSGQLRQPLSLTSNEKVDLTAFLLTLTDRHFLFNPAYSFPHHILDQ